MQEFWQIIGITIERIIILFATLAKYVWHKIKHQLYNGHGVSILTGMLTWEYFIQLPYSALVLKSKSIPIFVVFQFL